MSPLAAATLALPVLLGALAGWAALFTDPETAIGNLNRYALYLAFPALIVVGLTDQAFSLPSQPWFWAVVPAAMVASAAIARLLGGAQAGTLALAAIFGNVAYFGLPLCTAVLGERVLGTASLAVALFVLCSLLLGPPLLVAWSPGASRRSPWVAVLRQPLFWSPFVGLALRAIPGLSGPAHVLLEPLGRSAAPVALFLLGLYLWENRRRMSEGGRSALAHVAAKMLLFPGLLFAMVLAARAAGWTDTDAARIVLLLGATPTAIATFALAQEFGVGRERVAQAIVGTTLVSMVSLPAVVSLVTWLVG